LALGKTSSWPATAWAAESLTVRAALLTRAARDLAHAEWLVQELERATGRPAHEIWSAELLLTVDALRWRDRAGQRSGRAGFPVPGFSGSFDPRATRSTGTRSGSSV
jgi:hypothetical protein